MPSDDRQPQLDMIADFLRTRRSIRKFKQQRIPEVVLRDILTLANTAPSAHNTQPWRFVLIEENEARKNILEAIERKYREDTASQGADRQAIDRRVERTRALLLESPTLILVCAVYEQPPQHTNANEVEYLLVVQSVAAAVENLLLAAHAHRLGACWMGSALFCAREIRRTLELPDSWIPQAFIIAGFPAEEPEDPKTLPVEELIRYAPSGSRK